MPKESKTQNNPTTPLEKFSMNATKWVGSIESLIVHTIIFILAFMLVIFGIPYDDVLLVVTTIVSLEAIYLAIFIQMTVNRNTTHLSEVSHEIGEIQEDVDEIQKDVDEIAEDVDEIQKDVDEIAEDVDEIQEDVEDITEESGKKLTTVKKISKYSELERALVILTKEIQSLKKETPKK
jgi:uncharacterized membrane protein